MVEKGHGLVAERGARPGVHLGGRCEVVVLRLRRGTLPVRLDGACTGCGFAIPICPSGGFHVFCACGALCRVSVWRCGGCCGGGACVDHDPGLGVFGWSDGFLSPLQVPVYSYLADLMTNSPSFIGVYTDGSLFSGLLVDDIGSRPFQAVTSETTRRYGFEATSSRM